MSEPWKCEGCGWTNIGHVHECDGCGERQATAVLDRASLLARVEALSEALRLAYLDLSDSHTIVAVKAALEGK